MYHLAFLPMFQSETEDNKKSTKELDETEDEDRETTTLKPGLLYDWENQREYVASVSSTKLFWLFWSQQKNRQFRQVMHPAGRTGALEHLHHWTHGILSETWVNHGARPSPPSPYLQQLEKHNRASVGQGTKNKKRSNVQQAKSEEVPMQPKTSFIEETLRWQANVKRKTVRKLPVPKPCSTNLKLFPSLPENASKMYNPWTWNAPQESYH